MNLDLIHQYCEHHQTPISHQEETALSWVEDETKKIFPKVSHMQVGRVQGALLQSFAELIQAKSILEIGSFTGMSAFYLAKGLGQSGLVMSLDQDPIAQKLAEQFWGRAGISTKIKPKLGPALLSLEEIQKQNQEKFFDLCFIDADKANTEKYFEWCLKLTRPGGVILVDNTLWKGEVLEPKSKSAEFFAAYNSRRKNDPRVRTLILPIRDGLSVHILHREAS